MTSTASKTTIIIDYKTDMTEVINPPQTISTMIAWQTSITFPPFLKKFLCSSPTHWSESEVWGNMYYLYKMWCQKRDRLGVQPVITVCWHVHSCFQTIPCQTQGHIQYIQFKLTQHNITTVLLQIVYRAHSTLHSNQASNSEIGQFQWVHIKF